MAEVTYTGTVKGLIEKKGGWHTVEIAADGLNYPVKADTKLEKLLTQVRELRDGSLTGTFTVSETESENINPNSGKPYTERRLEKVELGRLSAALGSQPSFDSVQSVNTSSDNGGMTKDEWARKDSAIHKMACIKAASAALSHTIPSDPTTEDLDKYCERVRYLSFEWHRAVIATRDDPAGDTVPFN